MTQSLSLDIYNDPDIEKLKQELRKLEDELNQLSDQKVSIEKLLHDFSLRHHLELGNIILKILAIRKSKAKGTPKADIADKDFETYNTEYSTAVEQDVKSLSDEEMLELKKKYRRASKLCHPDVVNDSQKELAAQIFSNLNKAYEQNDLAALSQILESLENGNFFITKADFLNEKVALESEINRLRMCIEELLNQIVLLQAINTYKTIVSIENWDKYFSETKQTLEEQLKSFSE